MTRARFELEDLARVNSFFLLGKETYVFVKVEKFGEGKNYLFKIVICRLTQDRKLLYKNSPLDLVLESG